MAKSPKKGERVTTTKFQAAKINFEEKLKSSLDEASKHDKNGELEQYARCIRNTWKNSFRIDKIEILDLLDKWLKENGNSTLPHFKKLSRKSQFLKYVNADPDSFESHLFNSRRHYQVWDDIKDVIEEALRRQYHGGLKKLHKDRMTQSYEEGD